MGTPVAAKGCQAAAKALKKAYKGVSRLSFLPKGCLVYNNRVQYNTLNGKANKNAQPVCVQVTGGKKTTPKKGKTTPKKGEATTPKKKPTKKPTKKLVLAAKGKANCAGKGTAVQGFNGCKAAAKAIKKSFIPKPSRSSVLPKGCVVYNNKVQYNTLNGKANCAGKGTPVAAKGCQAAAKALKKAFKGVSRLSFLPKGCLVYNNRVQYNTLNGKANKNAQPVCVQVTGGKKT